MKKRLLRKIRIAMLFLTICAAGMGCSKQNESEKPSATTETASGTVPAGTDPSATADTARPHTESAEPADEEMVAELPASVIGWYFKEGDFCYRMELLPGEEPDKRGYVQMTYSVRYMDEVYREWSNALLPLHTFDMPYGGEDGTYVLQDRGNDGAAADYTVTMKADGTVMLEGDTEAAGVYYPCKGNLIMPEQYRRPLNDTDLIGLKKEDLRLLRNEIYAVHGRKFSSQDLQTYFGGRDWYRGKAGPENFDESVLGGMMRRNVAFLKAAEDACDEKAAVIDGQAYAALPQAPYLDVLPESGEVLVSISSDIAGVTDKGIYSVAKGSISVPVTMSPDQYKQLEAGGTVELIVDELTGETAVLTKSQNPEGGTYCFGDESFGDYTEASYDRLSGCWFLWANSADTRFKRVYEGDIFVLKGACEEFYHNFDMPDDKRIKGPGNYRVMDFNETDIWDQAPYSGNILVADSKGYVKALYFWGD